MKESQITKKYLKKCTTSLACSFLMRNRFGVDSEEKGDGEELRGVEGGKTVFRLCCMSKESMINKKEKK